jgi:hypothetical protein
MKKLFLFILLLPFLLGQTILPKPSVEIVISAVVPELCYVTRQKVKVLHTLEGKCLSQKTLEDELSRAMYRIRANEKALKGLNITFVGEFKDPHLFGCADSPDNIVVRYPHGWNSWFVLRTVMHEVGHTMLWRIGNIELAESLHLGYDTDCRSDFCQILPAITAISIERRLLPSNNYWTAVWKAHWGKPPRKLFKKKK